MSRAPFRMGVLGASRVAGLSTIPHARDRSDLQVAAVASRDAERARRFAAEHRIAEAFHGYEALLRRDDIDVVHVALPPALHEDWTIRALAAGKAVLCEKPLALDAAGACRMTRASAAAGRPLLEAFHYRLHPVMAQALDIVRGGRLGRVLEAEAVFEASAPQSARDFRWRPGPEGGARLDLGCYPVHALRSLLGEEPTVVRAASRRLGGVDVSTEAELAFPSGARARVSCSMVAPRYRADVWLLGERAELRIRNFVLPHLGGGLAWGEGRTWREEPASPRPTFAWQLDHLVQVLAGGMPLTGGADAVANMAALDAIRRKARG